MRGEIMINQINNKLLDFVTQQFSVDTEDIFLDESLIDQGIIDSTGLIEIVSFIEDEYSFSIEEEHLIMENFGSIEKIANFIKTMIENRKIMSN